MNRAARRREDRVVKERPVPVAGPNRATRRHEAFTVVTEDGSKTLVQPKFGRMWPRLAGGYEPPPPSKTNAARRQRRAERARTY